MGMSVSFEDAVWILTLPAPKVLAYSVDQVEQGLGFTYSAEERAALASVPFSAETLRACMGTHLLFPGVPLSVIEIRDRKPDLFFGKKGKSWWGSQPFAAQKGTATWHLLHVTAVEGSFSKSFAKQQALLGKDEEVPSARVVVTGMVLHFLSTGQRLFERCYVRTADVDADGHRVYVGYFVAHGLYVLSHWDEYRRSLIGLASLRKFQ